MPAKINLINQQIGNLLVLEETSERKNKSVVWKCKCLLCNNICFYSTKELRSDGIIQCHSCGTHREPKENIREDIVGKRFNNLIVNYKTTKKTKEGSYLYNCSCDCGKNNILVTSRDLKTGHTKSCGCKSFKYKKDDIINNRLILNIYPIGEQSNLSRSHNYLCKCLLCNRTYITSSDILAQTKSCGCLKSSGELEILQILNKNNINYIYQYKPIELKRQSFDFAILNSQQKICFLIEFDGEQHYLKNIKASGWNTYEHYLTVHEHDIQKNNYAKSKNIPLIRIPYWKRGQLTLESIFNLSLLDLKKVMEGE